MKVVTIPGVELVRAGAWAASTGPVTITVDDIADAVRAATDPEVDAAAVKIGHTSKLGDGAPALGWVRNLRASGDGRTLIGDLVDVPAGLAKLMPKAFRRRSAELGFGVRTPRGRTYRMALGALSLLGVQPPAVKGLADIEALYGLAAAGATATTTVALGAADGVDPAKAAQLDKAIAALDDLDLDDEVRSRAVAALEDAAGVTDATIPAAADDARDDDPAHPARPEGTETMDDAKLRELLGLEADADLEKAVNDLKVKAEAAPAGDETDPEKPAGDKPAGDKPAGDKPAEGELVGAGAAKLSADTIAALKEAGLSLVTEADADTLVKLAAATRTSAITDTVDDGIRAGRIRPAERAAFVALAGAEGENLAEVKAALAAMAPRFAVAELGTDIAGEAALSAEDEAAFASFEAGLFPDIAAQQAAAGNAGK